MSQGDPIDALLAAVDQDDRDALRELVVPIAGGSATPVPRSRWRTKKPIVPLATSSYVGGHPFLPSGKQWPVDQRGAPLHFVAQVAFAEVPPLDGFPADGLLQPFVESTDTWGLTFDGPRAARATSSSASGPPA